MGTCPGLAGKPGPIPWAGCELVYGAQHSCRVVGRFGFVVARSWGCRLLNANSPTANPRATCRRDSRLFMASSPLLLQFVSLCQKMNFPFSCPGLTAARTLVCACPVPSSPSVCKPLPKSLISPLPRITNQVKPLQRLPQSLRDSRKFQGYRQTSIGIRIFYYTFRDPNNSLNTFLT
jgi:hypothetical protein